MLTILSAINGVILNAFKIGAVAIYKTKHESPRLIRQYALLFVLCHYSFLTSSSQLWELDLTGNPNRKPWIKAHRNRNP